MCSTPLICCSRGVATVFATTSALAPGYCPVTLMTGGAISGYCAIGRRVTETAPRITNTIEMTAAKIGRSIKNLESRIEPCRLVGADYLLRFAGFLRIARGLRRLLRRHFRARPHSHQPFRDDRIVRTETRLHDAQTIHQRA